LELPTIQYAPLLVFLLAGVFAAREIVTFKEHYRLKYIFTPMVTALIAGLAILSIIEYGVTSYRILILIALLLSLIADTMLMVVEVDLMEQGIVYFLLAHVFYGIAFSLSYEFRGWNMAVAAILLVCLFVFYRGIRSTVGRLKIPILIYTMVLSAMLFFAVASLNAGVTRREICIAAGAVLFAVSDFLIVYLSFIRPHKNESVIVWAVYAPAQTLLALSCFG
jgi:uncharacterized membrane protein YhhN